MAAVEAGVSEKESPSSTDTSFTSDTAVNAFEHNKTDIPSKQNQNTGIQVQTKESDIGFEGSASPEQSLDSGPSDSLPGVSSSRTSIADHELPGRPPVRQDSGVGLDKKFAVSFTGDGVATGHIAVKDQPVTATNIINDGQIPSVSAIIVDLGNVCCNWTAAEALPISPAMLHRLLKTRTWYEYDSGAITQDECYARLAAHYEVSVTDVAEAFKQAAQSLSPNQETFDILRNLKQKYRGSLKFYLMSNIPLPEWKAVQDDNRYDWTIFDRFFPSGQVGMCKPELRFFRHVLDTVSLKPKDVVFIDDNGENILAARSLGIRSLRYKDVSGLKQSVKVVFDDPVRRGREWLQKNAKQMWSETAQGREVRDNFAQLFLYEAVGDLSLVSMTFYERTWNYYIEKPIDTVEKHPDDVDTTSMAMTLLPQDPAKAHSILDEMLTNANNDGIIMTYFDGNRPRIDPIVCVNAVRFFYKYGRGENTPALEPTKSWISDVLFHRAYLDGTYYYPTGEVFLYLFSRLLVANPYSDIYRATSAVLRERLQERVGSAGDALELAMRLISCVDMGVQNNVDLQRLEAMQEEDGGWPIGWLCQTGKISLKIGNKGVTTAFAVWGMEAAKRD